MTESRPRSAGQLLHWSTDQQTEQAARAHPIRFESETPAGQFPGHYTSAKTWDDRVVLPASWPHPLYSSPDQIMKFFRSGHYTQALAMVVSWGGMGRRSKAIYGDRSPQTICRIENTLQDAARSIHETRSIETSWSMLTRMDGVSWSAVITSKTLHFLCRSLGFTCNPPVAIDGAIVRKRLWPRFRKSIAPTERPGDWKGDSFDAYCRYMTAIRVWADQRNWTTAALEATIFHEFGRPGAACTEGQSR